MSEQVQTQFEQRVLVLAPTRKDGRLTRELFGAAGVVVHLCVDLQQICREVASGAAAVLLTEESLASDEVERLAEALAGQPVWSDLQILVLIHGSAESPLAAWAMQHLNNLVLLDRPVKQQVLVSAVQAAIRARKRQYQLRDLHGTLEQRVAERTAVAEQRARQLQALAIELTQAEQRERRRLAQILHDHLQQLLVGMKFSISMLKNLTHKPEQLQSIQQLNDLVDESIRTSRELTAELSPPMLYERGLPQAMQWLATWMHEKHGLQVEVAAEEDANPASEELRVLLYHAARELLFNVVKHAGATHARLNASRCQEEGCIRISVVDDGKGFDPAAPSEHDSGTGGLGLFSIHERLEVLGGAIQVSSAPGSGTSVTIQVPVGDNPPSAGSADQRRATLPVPSPETLIRILLADDHQTIRSGLAQLLRTHPDLDVIGEAADGQAAVELALRLQPDVILMDVSMPRLDGVQATRRIVAERAATCIIGLSMHEDPGTLEEMRRAGAVAYLTKSGPPDALLAAIRACAVRRT